MRVKIYNLSPDRENGKLFVGSDMMKDLFGEFKVEPDMYDEVFNADIETTDLERIFERFNTTHHPLFRGHSMSVSDVVVTEKGAFFCDSVGFKPIDFDESKTQKPEDMIKVVYKEPGRPAFETEIPNHYKYLSNAVKGLLETVYNGDDTLIVCNEEGKLIGMKGNIHLDNGTSIIAGPFFVCGDDGEDFRSLTEDEVDKYLNKYAQPEDISDEETQADVGFSIVTF